MDHLTALDAFFLEMESDAVQSNIGGLSVFEGPAPTHDEVCDRIAGKMQFARRCRQRVHFLPGRVGHPVWADDTDFDIEHHVLRQRLAGGDFAELEALHSEMVASHIDRRHPLWQVWVVDGLADGNWAILWKVHHAMVDGIAATDVMGLLLDTEPDPPPPPPDDWTPEPAPGVRRTVGASLAGALAPVTNPALLERTLTNPLNAAGSVASSLRAVLPAHRLLRGQPDSPINGKIGPDRNWRATSADLAEVKSIGKAFGGTVNDVVLAAVANGLEHFIRERGEDPASLELRAMVPVSVRTQDERGQYANRVSAVFVDLPLDLDDPVEKLLDLRHQMGHRKDNNGAHAGEVMVELAELTPPMLFALGERTLWRMGSTRRLFNTLITNVPGPQFPLFCLGRRMLTMHPYVMLSKDVRVATAILSYDGGIYFGVTGDRDSVPDVEHVCHGIDAGIATLAGAAGPRKRKARAGHR